jgi:hypothetical protein
MYRYRQRLSATALCLALSGFARAEIFYGTSTTNAQPYASTLVTFDTSTPGTFLSTVQMNGADLGTPASGNPNGQQFIVSGIDFQPSTFTLYGMGWRSGFEQRVYTINPNTGNATVLPSGPFSGAGSAGFNFDPVRNVVRLTSDQSTANQQINPATGATSSNTNFAYAAGDVHAGQTPKLAAVAYTNHAGAPSSTTLYGIDDTGTGTLVQIGTPGNATSADGGQLHTVGSLNLSFSVPLNSQVGFFISPLTGNAYAAFEPTANGISHLFSINLGTGAATDLGQIGPNGTNPIWGLTTVPEPGSLALVGAAAVAALRFARQRKGGR